MELLELCILFQELSKLPSLNLDSDLIELATTTMNGEYLKGLKSQIHLLQVENASNLDPNEISEQIHKNIIKFLKESKGILSL